MTTYEEKLGQFAEGKLLVRLQRPVRDIANATCDACGSTKPRILYGLKDEGADRYFFVGDTCLKELIRRGVVMRRFATLSAREAYHAEKLRRSTDANGQGEGDSQPAVKEKGSSHEHVTDQSAGPLVGDGSIDPFLVPVILVIKEDDDYRSLVCLQSHNGRVYTVGYGEAARYEEIWCRSEAGCIILEKRKRERSDALEKSVRKAWELPLADVKDATLPQTHAIGVGLEQGSDPSIDPLLDRVALLSIAHQSPLQFLIPNAEKPLASAQNAERTVE